MKRCCDKPGCMREAEPGNRKCAMHQQFRRIFAKKPKLDADGDGLCSSCNVNRGWHHGLCKQCLGAA